MYFCRSPIRSTSWTDGTWLSNDQNGSGRSMAMKSGSSFCWFLSNSFRDCVRRRLNVDWLISDLDEDVEGRRQWMICCCATSLRMGFQPAPRLCCTFWRLEFPTPKGRRSIWSWESFSSLSTRLAEIQTRLDLGWTWTERIRGLRSVAAGQWLRTASSGTRPPLIEWRRLRSGRRRDPMPAPSPVCGTLWRKDVQAPAPLSNACPGWVPTVSPANQQLRAERPPKASEAVVWAPSSISPAKWTRSQSTATGYLWRSKSYSIFENDEDCCNCFTFCGRWRNRRHDLLQLIERRGTWEERLAEQNFAQDASQTPHVHTFRVPGRGEYRVHNFFISVI